jgi:excinuclease UvrABC nuclease subunit
MNIEFKPVKEGNAVAGWVKALKGKSGVYLVRERGFWGEVLYCGESHTGRLNATLLRHFQHWTGPTAGPTFPAEKVEVAVILAQEEKTVELQNTMIAKYEPTLNVAGKPKGFFETIFGG